MSESTRLQGELLEQLAPHLKDCEGGCPYCHDLIDAYDNRRTVAPPSVSRETPAKESVDTIKDFGAYPLEDELGPGYGFPIKPNPEPAPLSGEGQPTIQVVAHGGLNGKLDTLWDSEGREWRLWAAQGQKDKRPLEPIKPCGCPHDKDCDHTWTPSGWVSVGKGREDAAGRVDLLEQIYHTLQQSKVIPFSEFDAKGTNFALGELMDKMTELHDGSPIGAGTPICRKCRQPKESSRIGSNLCRSCDHGGSPARSASPCEDCVWHSCTGIAGGCGCKCHKVLARSVEARELKEKSDKAYCDYIDQMRRPECLGYEHKLKNGSFGKAELDAHTHAGELLGRHRAFAEAAALPGSLPSPAPLSLLTRLRCAGGDLAMNLKDAATLSPERFNVAGVEQLVNKWNELIREVVTLEMCSGPSLPSETEKNR